MKVNKWFACSWMWIFAGFLGHFMIANQMSLGFGAVCWMRKESEDYFCRA